GGLGLGLGLERLVLEAVAREIGLRLRLKGHERRGKTRDPPASGFVRDMLAAMTTTIPFGHRPSTRPASAERVAEVLAKPGFGVYFTDHMVTVTWTEEKGWHDAELRAYEPLQLDPATAVLHYGQAIFEGLKAYRQPDGSVKAFRPDANAARFRRSARRMA